MDPHSAGESKLPNGSFPAHMMQKMDERVHEFEQGWITGNAPRIEDYLDGLPPRARRELRCGLRPVRP